MVEPAPGGGWGAGKFNILLLALLLSGCARDNALYSPSADSSAYFVDSHVHVPMAAGFTPGWPNSAASASTYRPGEAALAQGGGEGCGFTGRFDNRSALSYNFDDNRSQIGLNMSLNDHGSGMVNVSRAVIVFRYKLDQPKSPRAERCRYASHWQGLVGSSYNELFLRDHNSLWGEVKDRGLDFWSK